MNTSSVNPSDRPAPQHPSPHRHRVGRWAAWFALLGAPLAWSLQLLINVGLGGYACYPHDMPLAVPLWGNLVGIAVAVDVIALLICMAAGIVGYANWRGSRREKPGDAHELIGGGDGRTRFLAMAGMMTSAVFWIATVFSMMNLAGIQPCGG